MWTLGILRMMAYNAAQFVRRKLLRTRTVGEPPSWRNTFTTLRDAVLAMAADWDSIRTAATATTEIAITVTG